MTSVEDLIAAATALLVSSESASERWELRAKFVAALDSTADLVIAALLVRGSGDGLISEVLEDMVSDGVLPRTVLPNG